MADGDTRRQLDHAATLLTNLAQILDVVRGEWGEAWSAWDQDQRDGITRWLTVHYKSEQAGSPPAGECTRKTCKLSGESIPPLAGAAHPVNNADEPTTGPRPINKQVPEDTYSDEIRKGLRKQCGHIAECDCINGAFVAADADMRRELLVELTRRFAAQDTWKFAEIYEVMKAAWAARGKGE